MFSTFNDSLILSNSSISDLENNSAIKSLEKTAVADVTSDQKAEDKDNRDNKAQALESSVMQWFKAKGIEAGTPSEFLEDLHEIKLKKIVSQNQSKKSEGSSLLSRRLKNKLTLV